MPDNNYCRLGDASFGVKDGIGAFNIDTGYDYAQHDIATGKPTLQPMGSSLSAIQIDIFLRAYMGHDVAGTIEAINIMRASGEPQQLVFGNGKYEGAFVIKNINTRVIRTDALGVIQSADLSINLLEFADRESQNRTKIETRPSGERPKRSLQSG